MTLPTPPRLTLTPEELRALTTLYTTDGAWTVEEGRRHCDRLDVLLAAGVLMPVQTLLGMMYQLSPQGRLQVFGTKDLAHSLRRQQDRAYLRLCLQHYGWTRTTPHTTRHLTNYLGGRQLIEVMTDGGPALVGGQMTSGGYRGLAIKEIGERLRSPALHDRFQVILFTPRPSMGQTAAAPFANFLTLIPLVPAGEPDIHYGVPTRAQYVPPPPPWDTDFEWDTPHITASMAVRLRRDDSPLPRSSVAILCEPRSARIARFKADLTMDLAIADTQLRRHYGLSAEDIEGVPFVDAVLRPMHANTSLEVQTAVYLRSATLAYRNDAALMHLVGVGEMRRHLNVVYPSQWTVSTAGRHRIEEPDALWHRGAFDVAVEYDTGEYKLHHVLRKLDGFASRGLRGPVWGVPSARRAAFLQGEVGSRLMEPPLVTQWWLPETPFMV
ncbi:hypothetical protein E7T09_16255 [Deinococcus sp. KSM4-11]|uniref:hypothetical protein n=1 Tax=Deinococcus sp. KSM4-11 TaxID=2568654 RepID=UPI0010A45420|nr:hypothetical protein [Deinococcus sp. KSM4-11]THF85508.1 hypothetical protein E7T09_16255 [Deinococcus sp. KSM4-11]